jgi:sugar lactone lactonase YvrE
MVIDSKGRAYIGEFGFDLGKGAQPKTANLIFFDTQGDAPPKIAVPEIFFPNGCHFSKDEKTLYISESFGSKILAFDHDLETGDLTNKRTFCDLGKDAVEKQIPGHAGTCYPDGISKIDAEGGLWASTCQSHVMRVNSEGKITHYIEMPEGGHGNFCVGIGGPDMKTMHICVANMADLEDQTKETACLYAVKVETPVDV